jgi:hypothetical protein
MFYLGSRYRIKQFLVHVEIRGDRFYVLRRILLLSFNIKSIVRPGKRGVESGTIRTVMTSYIQIPKTF